MPSNIYIYADAFIQSDLRFRFKAIQGIIFFVFCTVNAMLYHWATWTQIGLRVDCCAYFCLKIAKKKFTFFPVPCLFIKVGMKKKKQSYFLPYYEIMYIWKKQNCKQRKKSSMIFDYYEDYDGTLIKKYVHA